MTLKTPAATRHLLTDVLVLRLSTSKTELVLSLQGGLLFLLHCCLVDGATSLQVARTRTQGAILGGMRRGNREQRALELDLSLKPGSAHLLEDDLGHITSPLGLSFFIHNMRITVEPNSDGCGNETVMHRKAQWRAHVVREAAAAPVVISICGCFLWLIPSPHLSLSPGHTTSQ